MKLKKIVLSCIALGAVIFFGTVGYVNVFDKEQAQKHLAKHDFNPEQLQIAQVFYNNGCQYCHSASGTENPMPFYANLPIVDSMMKEDIKKGTRVFLLDDTMAGLKDPSKLSEVNLAKLERVLQNNAMPIAKFIHVHWGARPDENEKKVVLDWIQQQRQANFLPKDTDGVNAANLIQPLPDRLPTDPAKVALGEMFYHDTRLSGDNTISCHTCHQMKKAGTDSLATSTGIHGQKGGINAPTVFNSAFNHLQFWDGRADDLAAQAGGPPFNPVEMGSKDWDEILAKFENDDTFKKAFLAVYPALNGDNITHAIAEFEKTLVTPNSAFDRYLKGEQTALTENQIKGYELFQKHKCDTCHVGAAMGGQSFEYMGLFDDYFAARGTPLTDDDNGRFNHTQDPADKHKFKVPTLRNVALTAPYMHDARTDDLKEAVRIMLRYQSGVTLPETEVQYITEFLESLTGEYKGKKLTLEK